MLPPVLEEHLSDYPCQRCLLLAQVGKIRGETVQRLPAGARAPLAHDKSGRCCYDCAAADSLVGTAVPNFEMARIAVGGDRQEQYRLPGAPFGLVAANRMKPSAPGALDAQLTWLERNHWFGIDRDNEP